MKSRRDEFCRKTKVGIILQREGNSNLSGEFGVKAVLSSVRGKFELSSLFFSTRPSWSCFLFIELRGYFFVLTRVSSFLFFYVRCLWLCFLLISFHAFFLTHVLSPQLCGFSFFLKKNSLLNNALF